MPYKIIVGLGNPGDKYEKTRHNAGFMALDHILRNPAWENDKKSNSLIFKYSDLMCVKPQTFMNNSGQSVRSVLSYYKLMTKKLGLIFPKNSDLSDVLTVIHDDLDIPFGQYKISTDSRSAGHKGVQSIIDALKTKKFQRVRIGIKTRELPAIPAERYVLMKFKEDENAVLEKIFDEVAGLVIGTKNFPSN